MLASSLLGQRGGRDLKPAFPIVLDGDAVADAKAAAGSARVICRSLQSPSAARRRLQAVARGQDRFARDADRPRRRRAEKARCA